MKNYEEMARDVLRRIDEYETDRKVRRAKVTKVAASVTPVCAAAVIGVGLWKGGVLAPTHNQFVSSVTEPTVTNADMILAENTASAESAYTYDDNQHKFEVSTSAPIEDKSVANEQNETNSVHVTDANDADFDSKPIVNTEDPVLNEAVSPNLADENRHAEVTTPIINNAPQVTSDDELITPPTTVTANQTEDILSTPPVEVDDTSSGNDAQIGTGNWWCILSSSLDWNGTTYRDNDMADVSVYTQDRYIGKVGEFNGEYSDTVNYTINPNDSIYTVKETDTVLLVVKADDKSPYGAVIVMSTPDWTLDKYEPERLEPEYVDSNDSATDDMVVFNGFCQ